MKALPRVRPLHYAYGASTWLWARERRWIALLAAAFTLLGIFLAIGEELLEADELLALDHQILQTFASLRRPWLTIHAIDITALGSLTVLALAMLSVVVPLVRLRDYRGALQLVIALLGVGLWTMLTKSWFARARPDIVDRLMEVEGYSFPSGHSSGAATMYVTLAMVVGRHVRTVSGRIYLVAATGLLALLIGLSRIYLGVHYPSDVASGLAFGTGWAFMLMATFEWSRARKLRARGDA